MIDYQFIEAATENGDVWERSLLEPLAPSSLTPFTGSLLAEVTARTWYLYFDRLGFHPAPRQRIVRMCDGHPFVNLSISARLDAENAGVAPPIVRIDGADRSMTAWEKPGLFASIKLGRGAQKIQDTLIALHRELPDIIAKAAAWYQRVSGLRWSQAEVLQIMEEIERVGAAAMLPFFAARHNLAVAYRRLQRLLNAPTPQACAALIACALGGPEQSIELDMVHHVRTLATNAAADDAVMHWLQSGDIANWQETAPAGAFVDALRAFMDAYGHRTVGEGEIAAPRWAETPAQPLRVVRALATAPSLNDTATEPDLSALLATIDGKARKEAQQLIERMRLLIELQSGGLHAFSYILAGTRRWALAAGREATADQRLKATEDVFFYEVEEVKQMMTGEWNISDLADIHATADERRATLAKWRQQKPVDLLWGDRRAVATATALPASATINDGALFMPDERVLLVSAPESAASIYLPVYTACATAGGAVFDPLAATARSLGRPILVACGADFLKKISGVLIDNTQEEATIE